MCGYEADGNLRHVHLAKFLVERGEIWGGILQKGVLLMAICNFGSLNIDHVYTFHRFVRPGETISCKGYQRFAGGKGLNQSVALAQAGAMVFHAGHVGPEGQFLLDVLEEKHVDSRYVALQHVPTGHAVIQVDAQGENAIFLYPGANHTFGHEDVIRILDTFGPDDTVLLQNEINMTSEALRYAAEKGMTVVFNPAPMTSDVLDFPLDCVDCFIVNETEAQALSGCSSIEDAFDTLCHRFAHATIILTLGKNGVHAYEKTQRIHVPSFVVHAVDTTAAGDTFIGYYLAERNRGKTLADAIRVGCAASALCVGEKGAVPSIPDREAVQLFLQDYAKP